MSALGSLIVKLALEYAEYTKGLDKGEQEALQFAKKVQGHMDTMAAGVKGLIGGMAAGLAGAFSVGAIINGLQNVVQTMGEVTQASQQLGIATERLVGMKLAAELVGISFDDLVEGMAGLSEQASSGKETFGQMGINLKDAQGHLKGLDTLLYEIADAFQKSADGTAKAAIAQDIMGDAGLKLIPLLNTGAAGLKAFQEQAEQLGLTFNASTGKAAKEFGNTLKLVSVGFDGVYTQVVAKSLPAMQAVAEAFMKAASSEGAVTAASQVLTGGIRAVATAVVVTATAFRQFGTLVGGVAAGVVEVSGGITDAFAAVVTQSGSMLSALGSAVRLALSGDFAGALDAARSGLIGLGQGTDQAAARIQLGFKLMTDSSAETMRIGREAVTTVRGIWTGTGDGVSKLAEAAATGKKHLGDLTGAEKAAANEMKGLLGEWAGRASALNAASAATSALTAEEQALVALRSKLASGTSALGDKEKKLILTYAEAVAEMSRNNAAQQTAAALSAQLAEASHKATEELQSQIKAEREKNEAIGLSARQVVELEAARMRLTAEEKGGYATALETASVYAGDYANAYMAAAAAARQQASALRELASVRVSGAVKAQGVELDSKARQELDAFLDPARAQTFGEALRDAFGAASSALGNLASAMDEYARKQAEIEKQRVNVSKIEDQSERWSKEAELSRRETEMQVSTYADLTGAAKDFFEEGSRGYKIMAAAEKGFRALELANAAASAAQQLGLIGQVTATKVAGEAAKVGAVVAGQATETAAVTAGEAARNTAKIPGVFMAFMSALGPWGMAAAGVAIAAVLGGAVSGGGGAVVDPGNTGTGTVLGDVSAQSESIANSIDALREVDTLTMRYSAAMLSSLRNIESSLAGVSSLIVRAGVVEASGAGIAVGREVSTMGKIEGAAVRAAAAYVSFGLTEVLGIGKALSNLAGKMFSTKTSITGQGITADPQALGAIMASGFQASYYADVYQKKKRFGFTVGESNYTANTGAADPELERQFGLILTGFADTVRAAAGPLDESFALVEQRLAAHVVKIGKINIAGLTGSEIQEKLSAVFGAAGDEIAAAALPGLTDFQRVGEGYLETVARVASGVEVAGAALDGFGVTALNFRNLANKQGDVAAEIVRESLVAAETAATSLTTVRLFGFTFTVAAETVTSGIGKLIEGFDGTAEEIGEVYRALDALRDSMAAIGLRAADVTSAMLLGAGGLDALTEGLGSFREGYYSEAEQLAALGIELADAFRQAGTAMPASREAFRLMVEGIDRTGEAGQKLFGRLVTLSDGFGQWADGVQAQADAWAQLQKTIRAGSGARNQQDSRADVWLDAQQAAAALRDNITDMLSAAQKHGAAAYAQAREAAGAMAGAQAGWMLLSKPLNGMALEMERVRANAEAMRPVLVELYGSTWQASQIIPKAIAQQTAALKKNFMSDVTDQLLQLTDASAYAAKQLKEEQAQRLADAKALGLSAAEIAKVTALHKAQTSALQAEAAAWKASAASNLRGWLDGQQLSDRSSLDPGRQFQAAQQQFASVVAAARGKDQAALDRVTSVADTLLSTGRGMYGSGSQYVALEAMTRRTVESLGRALELPGFSLAEQKAEQLKQTAELKKQTEELKALVVLQGAGTKDVLAELKLLRQRIEDLERPLRQAVA
ncbi:hypothetical protein [uncultured Azohydromonas sp.]|jgi:hypothetical protein|uniref:hypothetical protein n=1 Tax=uncultured Azohydromonas sp. TaxID=487342 RepID=UPI00262E2BF1|nr:hypothetical protein [uncultured Azohydromonas sp.]